VRIRGGRPPLDGQPRPGRRRRRARTTGNPSPGGFLADCQCRNHTPATLSVYRSALLGPRTQTFLDDQAVATVGEFAAAHLRSYEEELRLAGLSVATVHQYHRVLKTFLGFCERQDKALVEFMLKSGRRLSEVITAEVDDIVDLGDRGAYLKVRQGKGRKDRHVPLDASMYRRLRLYIDRYHPTGCPALFPTTRGDGQPLTFRGLRRCWSASARRPASTFTRTSSGEPSPRAIAAGVDPITLQRVLGHTTLTMVSRYVHYSPTDLLEAWQLRRT
jgi:integrase